MAHIISNRNVENSSEQSVLDTLETNLPDDYIIVPNVQVAKVPEIDFVILRNDIIITIEVKGWYNTIKGEPFAGQVQVGPKSFPNPILQVQKQMQELVRFLKHRKQAERIFNDPRVASMIYIRPVVIFSHPNADIQLPSTDRVLVLSLAEAAEKLRDPNLKRYPCDLSTSERERIAHLLLNRPLSTLPEIQPSIIKNNSVPELEAHPQPEIQPTISSSPISRFVSVAGGSTLPDTTPEAIVKDHRSSNRSRLSIRKLLVGGVLSIFDGIEQKTDFEYIHASKETSISHSKFAKALETELEDSLYHLLDEVLACNRFSVHLSQYDFGQVKIVRCEAEKKLTAYIHGIIQARSYRTKGTVKVEFIEDNEIEKGAYRIVAVIDETVELPKNLDENAPAPVIQGPYLEHRPSGEKFPLAQRNTVLGRSKQNDICMGHLDTKTVVSRKHACIRSEDDGWIIYDGGDGRPSSRGTYVNGEKLRFGDGCLLQDGHRIILGPPQRANPYLPLDGSLLFIFHENS